MKIHLIIVLCIIFCVLSCLNKKSYSSQDESVIPDSLYSFFPKTKNIENAYEYYRSSNAKVISNDTIWFFSVIHNFVAYKCNPKAIDSLVTGYRQNSIVEFKVNEDSIYFIISEKDEMKKLYKLNTLEKIYKKRKNKYILPSFHSFMISKHGYNYKSQTICGLPSDYEVIIMKSGREFLLPKNLYYDWYVLPTELKHGYTSGIAYSKLNLDIIYWVIAW